MCTSFGCRLTAHISDWTPDLQRTIAGFEPYMKVRRVHFMVIQLAACDC
jgi:hypothetical protein